MHLCTFPHSRTPRPRRAPVAGRPPQTVETAPRDGERPPLRPLKKDGRFGEGAIRVTGSHQSQRRSASPAFQGQLGSQDNTKIDLVSIHMFRAAGRCLPVHLFRSTSRRRFPPLHAFSVRPGRVLRLTTEPRQIWEVLTVTKNYRLLRAAALDLWGLNGKDRTSTGTVAILSQERNSPLVSPRRSQRFAVAPAQLRVRPTVRRAAARPGAPWDYRLE